MSRPSLAVVCDFAGATDPEGNIVRCEVDANGDGVVDAFTSAGGRLVVEYAQPGVFTNALRCVDAYGLAGVTTVVVTVHGAPPLYAFTWAAGANRST